MSSKASSLSLAAAAGSGLGVGIALFLLIGPGAGKASPDRAVEAHSSTVAAPPRGAPPAPPTSARPEAAAVPSPPPVVAASARPVTGDPTAESPSEPGPTPTAVAAARAFAAELEAAHARLHQPAEDAPLEQAVTKALDDVFGKARADKRFAKELYAAYGPGRFVRGGRLTALGDGVLARVRELDGHAIDPTPYDAAELEALFADVPRAGDEATQAVGAAFAVAVGALESPTFDRQAVEDRLAAVAGELDASVVGRAVTQVMAKKSDAVTAADIPRDMRLLSAFVDLVIDMRFAQKAGPFHLRDKAAVYEKRKKELDAFVGQVLGAGQAGLALLDPPHPQYARMREVYALYRGYEAAGACEKLPAAWRFRKGSKGKEVEKLQARLACEGYYQGPIDGVYDGPTTEAVLSYQRHHDLEETGQVLEETMTSLNVPIEQRRKQIALTLQRMREARFDRMGDLFLRVNLPAFTLRAYEKGQVVKEHKVIVGTNKLDDDKVELVQGHINRTKLLGSRLYEVIVNPTWILPKRVEAGELAAGLEKDPDHLTKSNIKKVKLGSGTEVYVQGAGKGNVLGKVKFLLEGTNAIYLHDTDKRHLFAKRRRDFSHGCMRVHEAIDFGRWILQRDGVPEAEIERAFKSDVQRGFDLKQPWNFVTEYMTVDLAADGLPIFYSDIYGYDAAYFADQLPPLERIRWGHSRLRPRWVPLMDDEVVSQWRKEGKPAPRNLGPDGKPLKKEPPATETVREP
ncbi:MAG: L,D-transpeptidase family protein [Deltaproteobacteria bacterium]|nr:L,D-transpeptidase family protein [Deltaproteobacteria bacterium]